MGVRKTFGARKSQLKFQFIHESLILALIALVYAIGLTALFIPLYNSVFDEHLTLSVLFQAKNIILFLGKYGGEKDVVPHDVRHNNITQSP